VSDFHSSEKRRAAKAHICAHCRKPIEAGTLHWASAQVHEGEFDAYREHFEPGPDHDFPAGRPADVIEAPRTGNVFHPTEKPVQLMMAFLRWTRGVVLDPFAGSGSTGVAAARLGRPFIGIECHEPYFDIMCRRIQDAVDRPDLFISQRDPEPVQQPLFGEGEAA